MDSCYDEKLSVLSLNKAGARFLKLFVYRPWPYGSEIPQFLMFNKRITKYSYMTMI